ncbi:YxeA family protein [Lacticaseibacillus chiayiensis]|nr:YxeA family protein [Lacticaseibacillus chiayiensis]UYN57870.1 YxeA family protein [Lacticaseibacillus chiayiensis]
MLIGLIALIVLGFGAMKAYQHFSYGGPSYYTRITETGKASNDSEGNKQYAYQLTGYDEKGQAKQLKFKVFRDRPLKMNAYLKMTYNEKRGITRWQGVPSKDVPKAARDKLQ